MKISKEDLAGHLTSITRREIYEEWILPIIDYYELVTDAKEKSRANPLFISRVLTIKSTFTKDQLINIAMVNYDVDDYFQYMVANYDPDLLARLVWEKELVDLQEIKITRKYQLLGLKRIDNYRERLVQIDPILARRYSEYMPKPEYHQWVDQTPSQIDQRFTNEKTIFSILPRLIDLITKDVLKVPDDGEISVPKLKKLIKELSIPEFFEDTITNKNKYLNTRWLVIIAKFAVVKKVQHLSVEDILRYFVKEIMEGKFLIWNLMQAQYSRVKLKGIYPLAEQKQLVDAITEIGTVGYTVRFDNFDKWIDYHYINIMPIRLIHSNSLHIKADGSYSRTLEVTRANYHTTVKQPFKAAFVYLLGTLGLVELYSDTNLTVAYKETTEYYWSPNVCSPFFRLNHFAVTDLGKYLLGISDQYTLPESDFVTTQIEFDSKHLAISLSQKDELIAATLKAYSSQVSPQLFVADKVSFLQEVYTVKDLQEKVKQFKLFFDGQKLPTQWDELFSDLKKYFTPLQYENVHYESFVIPEDGHEIMQLLKTNEKLQPLYIKGEGRRILVSEKNLSKFAAALRKEGWVL